MVAAPGDAPVTMPDVVPTVAVVLLLLLHMPPIVASLRVAVVPEHTVGEPVMATGTGFTVMGLVAMQPVPSV
jgi:hypothetical protein